ncbi:hypothetical protein WKW79_21185 [Variovorax robiniae]|uniref:Plasmid stabilization protein n=1 Tax=Variovorax robiniae TaxID=1836199 RepID=A0ABU8XDF2_9BURK
MPTTLIIRDLPEEVHLQLKSMAARELERGGRGSVAAVVRNILIEATQRQKGGLGAAFMEINRKLQAELAEAGEEAFSDTELDALFKRSDEVSQPANFE